MSHRQACAPPASCQAFADRSLGVLYLSTEITSDGSPETVLAPYLAALTTLYRSESEILPIDTSVFYAYHLPPTPSQTDPQGIVPLYQPTTHLAEVSDESAVEAERAFWEVVRVLGREKDGDDEKGVGGMWPAAERPLNDD